MPEFRWPTTPATLASTSFCATVVPTFGIGLVVLGDERELHVLAVDLDLGRVGFLDREARAVLVVLAEVRDAAGERADVADLDFGASGRGRRRALLGLRRGLSPQPASATASAIAEIASLVFFMGSPGGSGQVLPRADIDTVRPAA